MSDSREVDATDVQALRACAALCWQRRADLKLEDAQIEQVLIAWMAVGEPQEAAAASELLAARREAERKQAKFDGLLGS